MRIGFDARVLSGEKCGVANYLCKLLCGLVKVEPRIEIFLFSSEAFRDEFKPFLDHPRIRLVSSPLSREERKSWPRTHLAPLLKEHGIDIFHQPFNADGLLFRAPCPVVVTVHDLIPWILPGSFRSVTKEWRYKFHNWIWTRRANRLLTVSENSRKDLARLCRIPSAKITVTHLGADDIYAGALSPADEAAVLARHGLSGKRYIVNMGGLNQRRRHPEFILEGFARYREKGDKDVYLVFTGSIMTFAGFFEEVRRKIEALGLKDRVITTGYLSDRELKCILSKSQVSVVTSLYEGFCLPLVESFACGVPVIANDRGSVPEIAGEAALLVSPGDPDALSQGLKRFLESPQEQELFIRRGRQRALAFSWEKMAEKTLSVYEEVKVEGGVKGW